MFPKEVNTGKRCENVKLMYIKDVDGILLTWKVRVCENLTSELAQLSLGYRRYCRLHGDVNGQHLQRTDFVNSRMVRNFF